MASVVNRNKEDRVAHNFITVNSDGRLNRKMAADKTRQLVAGLADTGTHGAMALARSVSTWTIASSHGDGDGGSPHSSQSTLPLSPILAPVSEVACESDSCVETTGSLPGTDRIGPAPPSHLQTTQQRECVGEKAGDYVSNRGADYHKKYPGVTGGDTLDDGKDLQSYFTCV